MDCGKAEYNEIVPYETFIYLPICGLVWWGLGHLQAANISKGQSLKMETWIIFAIGR